MPSTEDRLRVTYELDCVEGDDPEAKALEIAFEQTVELPDDCVPRDLCAAVVGRVEAVEPVGERCWRARIAYRSELVGDSLPQLLNLLFGNISLRSGIRLTEVDWPPSLLEQMPGPRFGIAGLRQMCGVTETRPLTCAVAKPVGLEVDQLAHRCREFALAGIDMIKDDHSLADQPWAPFGERVRRCQEAIAEANQRVNGSTAYFATLGGGIARLPERLEMLRSLDCKGVVTLPAYHGLDTVRWLAETSELAVLGHPAGSGVFFHREGGIAAEVWLGQILRLAGCDAVIFPHLGGRLRLSPQVTTRLLDHLGSPLGSLRPAAPAPGGSVDVHSVGDWVALYGRDAVFVVGASLLRGSSIRETAGSLAAAVRAV